MTPFQASSDGKLLIGKVIPTSGPESDDTASLVTQLQDDVLPERAARTARDGRT